MEQPFLSEERSWADASASSRSKCPACTSYLASYRLVRFAAYGSPRAARSQMAVALTARSRMAGVWLVEQPFLSEERSWANASASSRSKSLACTSHVAADGWALLRTLLGHEWLEFGPWSSHFCPRSVRGRMLPRHRARNVWRARVTGPLSPGRTLLGHKRLLCSSLGHKRLEIGPWSNRFCPSGAGSRARAGGSRG